MGVRGRKKINFLYVRIYFNTHCIKKSEMKSIKNLTAIIEKEGDGLAA
jgi:hypothetical protein